MNQMKYAILMTAVLSAALLSADDPSPTSPTYAQLDRLIQSVDRVGGGVRVLTPAQPDDLTVTTNYAHGALLEGKMSLYGARTAEVGNVPKKTADGSIVWAPESTAWRVTVEGQNGSETTTAICTNKLRFVSSPESNVRFDVTGDGNGNVTISVGVYYK